MIFKCGLYAKPQFPSKIHTYAKEIMNVRTLERY